MLKATCSGVKQTGYWKGYPCGAFSMFEQDGKGVCKNHLDPSRPYRELPKNERKTLQARA
jgi:hypothetical protein